MADPVGPPCGSEIYSFAAGCNSCRLRLGVSSPLCPAFELSLRRHPVLETPLRVWLNTRSYQYANDLKVRLLSQRLSQEAGRRG